MLVIEMPSKRTKMELERSGNVVVVCQIGNKVGYIAGPKVLMRNIEGQKRFQVVIQREKKVPIYRQAMQLQMGRKVKVTEYERDHYIATVVNKETILPMTTWKAITV